LKYNNLRFPSYRDSCDSVVWYDTLENSIRNRLLKVKAKLARGLLKVLILGSLKISIFVIIYSMDWLLRAVMISVLSIYPNSVKNPLFLYFSSIIISANSCFISVSSLFSNRLLTLLNSTRNILK
jgi:hypothetical protein